jgi:hypothetical protein
VPIVNCLSILNKSSILLVIFQVDEMIGVPNLLLNDDLFPVVGFQRSGHRWWWCDFCHIEELSDWLP